MKKKELAELTDEELLREAKKQKKSEFMSALVIGFMAGVIVFSVVKNTLGLCTLIPLYFIYKIVKNPKKSKALEVLLKERNLK